MFLGINATISLRYLSLPVQSFTVYFIVVGGYDGFVVSAFVSRSSGSSSSPGQGHCAVFLGKTLYSDSASFHPGAQMGFI